ncbi:MAG: asparagine synthase (glutamine-hydrolyzing) [Rhodanobacter sp.]|nr:asparagine synthase (glutamine-hydrolyzing) [Rhodanobacter sp.]
MCGIAGLLAPSDTTLSLLGGMLGRLSHRGPDNNGVWRDSDCGIGLGHRRLSIIDLTPAGHQPMLSASQRHVLVYNGEIYNHVALRRELDSAGLAAAWRGTSDTETLLTAVETLGVEGALERCNGMFAFALWDRQQRRLVLVRDRMGEKPLYFGWIAGRFVFASELKALASLPGWAPHMHVPSVTGFLRTGYVHGFESAVTGVFRLPPGCLLRLSLDELQQPHDAEWLAPKLEPYWSLPAIATEGLSHPIHNAGEATRQLEALLRDAVAMRMAADVPLGAFLSGGIDSSLVTALMQTQSDLPVRTFSIGFHEPRFDEAPFARAVAKHLGTEHTELYVDSQAALDLVPSLTEAFDEPFADSSQLPTLLVSQLARRHVTVALTGDGGDELFAGYQRYFAILALWRLLQPLPLTLRRASGLACSATARLLALLPSSREPVSSMTFRFSRLAERMAAPDIEAMRLSFIAGAGHARITSNARGNAPSALAYPALHEPLRRLMFGDQVDYLPDDILFKVDRAAMAHSLETRIPLLDHRVVALSWQLATPLLATDGRGKQPLRRILEKYVPASMFERPKQGFAPPMDAWLRGPLREWAEAGLSEKSLRELPMLNASEVRNIWKAHIGGRMSAANVLWNVLMLSNWREHYRVTC